MSMPVLFHIVSEEQLQTYATEGHYTGASCNSIFEHLTGGGGVSLANTSLSSTSWLSPSVDVTRYHSVFIHSSIADGQTIDATMQRTNVLKKVRVTVPSGSKIYDSLATSHDYADVSGSSVRLLLFSLRDKNGSLINLQGSSWSLSIVLDYS